MTDREQITADEDVLKNRMWRLRERFKILTFVSECGAGWAAQVLEKGQPNFSRAHYIHAYQSGLNN